MTTFYTFLNYFIGSLFVGSFYTYAWIKLININMNLKENKCKIAIIILSIALFLPLKQFIPFESLRLIINVIGLICINYFLLSKSIKLSITSVMISSVVLIVSELIFALLYSALITKDNTVLYTTVYNGITINIIIAVIAFIIFNVVKIFSRSRLLIKYSNKSKNKWITIYSIFFILLAIFSTCSSYLRWNPIYVLIINMIVICLFIFTVTRYIIKQGELEKINNKYENSISSLKEYEVMIDKFRVDTHENKNEFLTIRNMLKDKNNKENVIKYIDTLVDNKIKDNDKIMKQTSKIPEGGLRATIYSKLCLMDKLKIKHNLIISRDVRTTDLINLDEDLVLKICKILGVFLDNAIDAVRKLRKREIVIELYILNKYLCINITNNFKGNLDIDKITNIKYTTKGKGHGYGLTLVNNILNEEPNKLINEKSITNDTFTQTLKIKI